MNELSIRTRNKTIEEIGNNDIINNLLEEKKQILQKRRESVLLI
jgi:hypothetical protein